MSKSDKLKILVVDDEAAVAELIVDLMQDSFDVLTSTSAEAALEQVNQFGSELCAIISDYKMSGMNGFEFREKIPVNCKDIPFILMSAFISKDDAIAALHAKIAAFLPKPFESNDFLVSTIKKFALDRESVIRERMVLEQIFVEEATNIVEELEPLIMSLEQKPNSSETLNTIFRLVHTIKGSSGVLESTHIRSYVHKYEDLLSKLKNGSLSATPEIVSILLAGFDTVGQMIAALRNKKPWTKNVDDLVKIFDISKPIAEFEQSSNGQDDQTVTKPEAPKENVSVPARMLDDFMELSGEITVIRNMVNKLVRVIEKESPGNKNVAHLGELLDEMHKINSSMQGRLVETRKVPLSKVFRPIPRTVRDTAHALGKSINLTVEGDKIRVDTALAQALSESLIHIVRNSIDHGIESKDKRVERRKKPEGEIVIRAKENADEITIEVQDDGGGLDTERIKKKAVEKGIHSPQDVEHLSRQKIFSLIFESGFSTAQHVTDVSGRGVGMDMVRSSIQKVRGRIDIESELGRGTKFILKMPIPKSVLIINSLIVESGGRSFALAQDSIARLFMLDNVRINHAIKQMQDAYLFEFDGHLLPLVDLAQILGLREPGGVDYVRKDSQNILIIQNESCMFALAVDRILDSEEIVVKSVGKHLERAKVYAGVTFMGDGTVGLILSASGMAEKAGIDGSGLPASDIEKAPPSESEIPLQEYLLFNLWCRGSYAVPLAVVHRLEEVARSSLQVMGGRRVLIYRDQTVPVIDLSASLGLQIDDQKAMDAQDLLTVFVLKLNGRYVAFVIREIKDVCLGPTDVDTAVKDRPEIYGCIDINHTIVSVLDLPAILDRAGLSQTFDPQARLRDFAYGPDVSTSASGGQRQEANGADESVVSTQPNFVGDGWGIF
jgi:two-component system chemotaxis sensor kinase CheA